MYRRSNLTREQQKEAEAAIYGLERRVVQQHEYTQHEIDIIRATVSRWDAEHAAPPAEFDLNNPPKQPYAHQEYPKVLYHHATGRAVKAEDGETASELVEAGWSLDPLPGLGEPSPIELDAASAAEAAAIDARLKKKKV